MSFHSAFLLVAPVGAVFFAVAPPKEGNAPVGAGEHEVATRNKFQTSY